VKIMSEHQSNNTDRQPAPEKTYRRFNLSQRIEHLLLLLSFTVLGVTGLAQKYDGSWLGSGVLNLFGGITASRQIHHIAAYVLTAVSLYHVITLVYYTYVRRTPPKILPAKQDFVDFLDDLKYYVGRSQRPARYGRFSYGEKFEYLAVVWGTLIMAITGFMLLNPVTTARLLPGQIIPAALAAHSGEALLAVLAILVWHFYHVHVKRFNTSIFTGKMTREEMEEEHPRELEERAANSEQQPQPDSQQQKRRGIFIPVAAVLSVVFGLALYWFITAETTAITTVLAREPEDVFTPLQATPGPNAPAIPSIDELTTWEGGFGPLFAARCTACHGGQEPIAGLDLTNFESAVFGGESGPAIVPGNPNASAITEVLSSGEHPGKLSQDQFSRLVEWIEAGAP
jgi:cytochrome b subunit of formate dehydrogenase